MNKKLIIAILIVAVIGVVAATYQVNNDENILNTLANVDVEAGITDIVDDSESGDSQNDLDIDDGTAADSVIGVPSTSSSNSGSSSNSATQSSSNGIIITDGGVPSVSTANVLNSTTNPLITNQSTTDVLSQAEALRLATQWAVRNGITDAIPKIHSTTVIDGVPYYNINFFRKGTIIGYIELESTTQRVLGGAFENEVNPSLVPDIVPAINDSNDNYTITYNNTTTSSNDTHI